MIDNEKLVALDIETSNGKGSGALEPRHEGSQIALVQLAYEDGRIEVLRWNESTLNTIKRLISEDYRFLIHNASFELDWFLVKAGLRFDKIWCTMLASQILNAGKADVDSATAVSGRSESKNLDYLGHWTPLLSENDENLGVSKAGRFSHSLQATVYRYANGAKIQKDQGNSDWAAELTDEQLRYAKDDVRYLVEVARNQWDFIKRFKMEAVVALEMKVAIAVNEMKYRGILIDKNQWLKAASDYGKEAEALEKELNYALGLELAQREGNETVFGTFIPKSFKVSSPTQLAKFFGLDNADEAILKGVDHPLIPKILKYKESQKIASTYGKGYLDFIMADGRIHSLLPQTETATGRFKSRKPNLQNIPPEMLKSFLSSAEGKLLVFADYSAMESRILAYAADDANFIKSVNSKDVHWENAKKIFGLPENANKGDMFTVETLGKTLPGDALRRMSKGVSFGIPYGISAVGLVNRGFAENADIGQDLIDGFLGQYPQVAKFLKSSVTEALTRGYTQDPFGRIRWYEIPKRAPEDEIRQATNRAARQAQNHKIQSMSANITKQAIVDLHEYLEETGRGYMVLTIHDSVIFEINEEDSGTTVSNIIRIMEEAGPKIFPGMLVPVDVDLGHKVHRSCKVTGIDFSVYSHVFKDGEVRENDTWVEPRVFGLLIQQGFDASKDYNGAIVKLTELLRIQTPEWLKENKDIVNAVERANDSLPF
jgi:DNA polymerase-1